MALTCSMSFNATSCSAQQTPPPMATLTVYNPNASTVTVTGVQLRKTVNGQTAQSLPTEPSVVPIGPGMTVSVPTLSSITIGPFPITMASASNTNAAATINQTGNPNPVNPQPANVQNTSLSVGALVYGSDGSVNTATPAVILVNPTFNPPLGTQGGVLQFNLSTNSAGVVPGWP